MSNNKYIIDEDSLTGIADAVRNKLGNGEAITDEDAGYYPVTVKKLGFSQTADTAGYSGPGSGYTSNTIYARPILELENICGIRPSYIKVTVTNSTGFKNNDIIFRYTNAGMPSSSMVASTNFANYIAILPIPDDIDDCYIAYGAYYSTYSSQYTSRSTPPYDVVFLDSNQNEIYINEYSEDSFVVNTWGATRTFLTGTSFEKIPLTIDDIQDRITNYLNPAQEALQANRGEKSSANTYSLDVTNLFSSTEDLLDRMQQVITQNGSSVAYLRCGADGRPLSMKAQGISLPNNISSNRGGWNMDDVRAGYDNGLTFKFNFMASSFNQLNRWLWIYNKNGYLFLVLCQDTSVGVPLNNNGTMFCFYKGA